MTLAERLARPEILDLVPYQTAYDEGGRKNSIKLDANENPYAPLGKQPSASDVNRYPEPQPEVLRRRLAELYNVPRENLLLGRGADEAIDLLVRAFCRPTEDAVVICPPTFGYYETAARVQGARVLEVPLTQIFHLEAQDVINAAHQDESVKLIFLCSPMNPTGNSIPRQVIIEICQQLPETLVVLDEAYIEFSDQQSLTSEAHNLKNLVVLRTLSKAYGLAGARCGSAIADPAIIEMLFRISSPYPISSVTRNVVADALSPYQMPLVQKRISEIRTERAYLYEQLQKAPEIERLFPSDANALFVQVRHPDKFEQKMVRAGIKIRRREAAAPGGFRITVGTPEENRVLLQTLGLEVEVTNSRQAETIRTTKETSIACRIDLDELAGTSISTGIGFFDHMLEQIARHAGFSLTLICEGDLEIDPHHTIEDCMLTFGECLAKALGDKRGIGRFGFLLPMDETEAQVSIDLGGRPFIAFNGSFQGSRIGEYPTEMTGHAFRSIADSLKASIHISVTGENDHHKTEACFKAFGRALRMAIRREGDEIPSTKGVL